MINKFYKILFNILIFFIKKINFFLSLLNKKNFLQQLHDTIEEHQLITKEINKKKITFFCPSTKCFSRVQTLYTKEPETINWINNFDQNRNIKLWDIGANIGLYSIYAATKFNDIEVIAFEPSTSNTRVLSRNISLNKLDKKIKIFQLALSNQANIVSQFKETNFQEGGSLSTFKEKFNYEGKDLDDNQIENQYQIFGTSLNDLIDKKILDVPNYIKCDVDGLEHLILQGADQFLIDQNLLEISIEVNEKFKKQYDDVIKILKLNNFYQHDYYNANNISSGNMLFKKKTNV
jgi:FkbM family methyltransferase